MSEPTTTEEDPREQYIHLLNSLFTAALAENAFDVVCAVLRVGGMADANWDPFEESRLAFDDYNWILDRVAAERGDTAARRVGLLMYCQAVEMDAPQEIMANLLRCLAKKPYTIDPFLDLWTIRKGKSSIPPSATRKYKSIGRLAGEIGRPEIKKAIEVVFDERVRNARIDR